MHAYVLVETTDGLSVDGIITGLDDENLYLAVPLNQSDSNNPATQSYGDPFFRPGYPYQGYRPPRRFRRLIIPLTFLAALSLLPWY